MKVSQIKDGDVLTSKLQKAIHVNPELRYQHRLHVVLMVLQFQNVQYATTFYQEPKRTVQ